MGLCVVEAELRKYGFHRVSDMVQKTLPKITFPYEVTLTIILLQYKDFLDAEKVRKGWDQQKTYCLDEILQDDRLHFQNNKSST